MNHPSSSPVAADTAQRLARFAATHIATASRPLDRFPLDLWQRLATEGLLGLAVPTAFGGGGGDWRQIGQGGRVLAEQGGDLGFAMSWQLHAISARLVVGGLGSPAQQARLLPEMAAGRLVLSVAVSEPGIGAHPKYLRTTAERRADGWRLNGEKTFLTNGPIAGLFLVVACSGVQDGRKQFSAFLVPKDCPGLTEVAMPPLGFLTSSPHCGIRLDNCLVATDALLGEEGTAFAALSLPLRHVEDTLGASLNAGAMRHELNRLAVASAALDALPEDAGERLGALAGILAGIDCLADAACAGLDCGLAEGALATAQSVGFRTLAQHFQRLAGAYAVEIGAASDAVTAGLLRDIDRSLDIAKSARLMKQSRLGLRLFNHGG